MKENYVQKKERILKEITINKNFDKIIGAVEETLKPSNRKVDINKLKQKISNEKAK